MTYKSWGIKVCSIVTHDLTYDHTRSYTIRDNYSWFTTMIDNDIMTPLLVTITLFLINRVND